MYSCKKLHSIQPEDNKRWAKYYTIYYLTNIMIGQLAMVGYDMANDNISDVILPNALHLCRQTSSWYAMNSNCCYWHQQDSSAHVVYHLSLLHLSDQQGRRQPCYIGEPEISSALAKWAWVYFLFVFIAIIAIIETNLVVTSFIAFFLTSSAPSLQSSYAQMRFIINNM